MSQTAHAQVTRIKKTNTHVPATMEEADQVLAQIGEAQSEANQLAAELKAKIKQLKDHYEPIIAFEELRCQQWTHSLFAFASPRYDTLTAESRTVKRPDGSEFGWRWSTPFVDADGSDEDIIASLKAAGLSKYIRTVEEVDREALLADRPDVESVSYQQREDFFVKPIVTTGKRKTVTKVIDD